MRLDLAIEAIRRARERTPPQRSALIAVSGIDASGKGYLTARLAASLAARGVRAAVLGVDGWLNLPWVRFDPDRPGEAFYERGIRFDEMFARLVVPFRDGRSIHLVADHTD